MGVVGKSIKYGFNKLGHTCIGIDKNNLKDFSKTLNSNIIFLTLPTPLDKDRLDQSLIEHYLKNLIH